jgi:hypothetical protein
MVEGKMCHDASRIVESGHYFSPFGEVFNGEYYVLFSITRWRISCHEIDAPFTEGVSHDYGV